MIATMLAENTACRDNLHAEHGLSLYLEAGESKVLFDMGQSDAFVANARSLNVNLAAIDFAVLSHGHYDHGGGLRAFFTANDHAPVYVSRHAFEKHGNTSGRDIGLDPALSSHPRLIFTDDYQKISDGLELFTCNTCQPLFPVKTFGLTMSIGDHMLPEDFRHEQYLLIQENARRILISGCSHKNVLNLVEWFQPDVLIGGFHLMNLDPQGQARQSLDEVAYQLLSHPAVYYTCHCTGVEQYQYLKSIMKEKLHYLPGGQTITL